jgi:hypothetical protein
MGSALRNLILIIVFFLGVSGVASGYTLVLREDCETTEFVEHFMEAYWGSTYTSYWTEFKSEVTRSGTAPYGGSYSMTYDPFDTGDPHATMGHGVTGNAGSSAEWDASTVYEKKWYFRWYHKWETGITWGGTNNKIIHVNQSSVTQGTSLMVAREGSTTFHITLRNDGDIIYNTWKNSAESMDDNEWHKIELYIDYGTNSSDTELIFTVDDVELLSVSGLSMSVDTNPVKFINDWPGNISGTEPTGSAQQWLDNFEIYTLTSSSDIPPEDAAESVVATGIEGMTVD